jgi:hypothetical protein
MIAILIKCVNNAAKMVGLVPHLEDGRLSLLQYVGYTIIYLEHVLEKTKNLKLILLAYVQLSRAKNQFP